MNYSATAARSTARGPAKRDRRQERRAAFLGALGAMVRSKRTEQGLTLRALAEKAKVSLRFLMQLETGEGNISVARLQDVAEALQTTASELLSMPAGAAKARGIVSFLGLRGAGKSAVGHLVARKLGVPFVELDALIAREAGMDLTTIFEIHGDAYFRRLEREALRKFLDSHEAAVLATGGSIVSAPESYELLRRRTTTVWLKARAREHWDRVVAQGDVRPMKNRANAMSELQALLRARKPLYAQAEHAVDTSGVTLHEAAARVLSALKKEPNR